LYSGYVNNLDTNYVGTQTVTISYKGKYTTLKVTSRRNIGRCGICGKYYAESYSDEILKELYEGSGTYYFKAEDYFSIDITNRSKTLGTRVLGIAIPDIPLTSIHVEYGGAIRDETQVSSN